MYQGSERCFDSGCWWIFIFESERVWMQCTCMHVLCVCVCVCTSSWLRLEMNVIFFLVKSSIALEMASSHSSLSVAELQPIKSEHKHSLSSKSISPIPPLSSERAKASSFPQQAVQVPQSCWVCYPGDGRLTETRPDLTTSFSCSSAPGLKDKQCVCVCVCVCVSLPLRYLSSGRGEDRMWQCDPHHTI